MSSRKNVKMIDITGTKLNKKNIATKQKKKSKKSTYNKRSINLLEDDYVKPKYTASDLITAEELKKRMENYEILDKEQVADLVSNTRIQYFEVKENGDYKYKPGGVIIKNGYPDYLVLTNGRRSWSVQLVNHVICKEMRVEDVKAKYEKIISKKDAQIKELIYFSNKLKKELMKYKR